MQKRYNFIIITVLLVFTIACLDFGPEEETTTPTEEQVNLCKAELYIQESANITPLGFKLDASGIDDRIWFKFETDADDLTQIFDTSIVDVSAFTEDVSLTPLEDVTWWDVEGKTLWGGHVALPNVRYMMVGAEKIEGGYIIYIMWNET